MGMSHPWNRGQPWVVVAWLTSIATGALTTSLLRVPVGIAGIGSAMLASHVVSGAIVGLVAVASLTVPRGTTRVSVALVVATLVLGWISSRSFAPITVAAHAAFAAFASLALAATWLAASSTVPAGASGTHRWKSRTADAAVVLVLLQIGLGALLRHQLIALTTHLLAGGVAALMILVPAVAITQDTAATRPERRASRLAIAALLVQVSLGVAVLFMILSGSTNAPVWLFTTITHVVVGSLTLLAVARLASVLRENRSSDTSGAARTAD
jgi:hypothetical protein